jgi:hypothetical protein
MAMHLKADGTETPVEPANGKGFTLAEVQRLCGGYVQLVDLGEGMIMLLDEDGKTKPAPLVNERATQLARPYLFSDDYIVGDVLVCTAREFD